MEPAGLERGEGFALLGAQDAGEDEASARTDGVGDLRGGLSQDLAEDVGGHERVLPARSPAEEIFPGQLDPAAAVAAEVGLRGLDGTCVIIESVHAGGAEFFGGDGEDAGAGADVEGGPARLEPRGLGAQETQTGGRGGVFPGAEGHGSGDAKKKAGLRLRGRPRSVGIDHGEVTGDAQGTPRRVGPGRYGDGINTLHFAAELLF